MSKFFVSFKRKRFIGHVNKHGFVSESVDHCCDQDLVGDDFIPSVECQVGSYND